MTRLGGRAELELWIRHLVLCALVDRGEPLPTESVYVGRCESDRHPEPVVSFGRVEQPLRLLRRLFEWAVSVERAPLPFFPRSSRVFADRVLAGKLEQARREAYQKFEGGTGWRAERPESTEDLDLERVWEGLAPLSSDAVEEGFVLFGFEELASEFFGPLGEAREVHRA
jgi:exonuclease V gamma subunit